MSEATRILAAAMLLLSTAGCSFSYSVIGLSEDGPEITGSIPKKSSSPLSADLDEEDWRRAKAALAVALDPQGPGTLVSWDNPDTALKGHFTPTGAPYVKNDEICRAFSAQVSGNTSASLSGHACRPSGGDWAIKDVKPAKGAAKI